MKKFLLCLWALTAIILMGCGGRSYLEATTESFSSQDTDTDYDTISEGDSTETFGYVQLTGAVNNPGVYKISEDTRLFEVIDEAGGFTPDADTDSVNQAIRVADGDNVHIPTIEETRLALEAEKEAENASKVTSDGKVNINTADATSLMTLPGIGQSKADMIIEYRDTNGSFARPEDIMNITGIKEGVYNKIKDKITVG